MSTQSVDERSDAGIFKLAMLSDEQLDGVREVGNIGCGQAASYLSAFLNRSCKISLPEIDFLDLDGMQTKFDFDANTVVCIFIEILGELPAATAIVCGGSSAHTILRYLTEDGSIPHTEDKAFNSKVALTGMGEVITSALSSAIHQFLGVNAHFHMPEVTISTWSKTAKDILRHIDGASDEKSLVLHTGFFDSERTFEGEVLYILPQSSIAKLLDRLQLLLDGAGASGDVGGAAASTPIPLIDGASHGPTGL